MTKEQFYIFIKNFADKISMMDFLRHVAHFSVDLFSKNVLIKNKSLQNIYFKKRCFIFGTGVSVNSVVFSLLADEYTFGGHLLNEHPDFHKLNLKFFVTLLANWAFKHFDSKALFINPYIYSEENIKPWLQNEKPILRYSFQPNLFFRKADVDLNNNTVVFLNSSSKKLIEKNKTFSNKKVFYLKSYKPILSVSRQRIDLSKRITFMEGVIFAMMAIAMYMGFNEIYLVGNDYTFQPSLHFHFYDSPIFSKKLQKGTTMRLIYELAKARNLEVYKIEEDEYFYKPLYVQYIPSSKVRDKHLAVRKFAKSINVKIYNIVPDGFDSPIYEKISWGEVVSKVLKNN